MTVPGEVVAAVEDPRRPGPVAAVAESVAALLGVPARILHTDDDDVVSRVLEEVRSTSMLVLGSRHANRWSGKHSVAEQCLDGHDGPTMVVGPRSAGALGEGDVLVPLDGSSAALAAVPFARELATRLARGVSTVRVVPPDGGSGRTSPEPVEPHPGPLDLRVEIVVSDDVIDGLAEVVAEADPACVVMSSRGDRSHRRSTISRVCTGLIAASTRPVVVVPESGGEPVQRNG